MSDYTLAEIDEAFQEDGWGEAKWSKSGEVTLRDEQVEYTTVASAGGEGEGDDIWVVIKLGDTLYRKDGYYASHYGTDWDGDLKIVTAQEKTIIVYE